MFCARCGSNQDDEAVLCNQCGYIMDREKYAKTPGTFVPERKNAPVADPPRKAAGAGCLLVLVVMACLYLFACNGINDIFPGINPVPTNTPAPTKAPTIYNVMASAEHFVSQILKAPATAKYPAENDWTVRDQGDGIYLAESYVDSENSFGALIRSTFAVKIQHNLSSGDWDCVYIILDGEIVYQASGGG